MVLPSAARYVGLLEDCCCSAQWMLHGTSRSSAQSDTERLSSCRRSIHDVLFDKVAMKVEGWVSTESISTKDIGGCLWANHYRADITIVTRNHASCPPSVLMPAASS